MSRVSPDLCPRELFRRQGRGREPEYFRCRSRHCAREIADHGGCSSPPYSTRKATIGSTCVCAPRGQVRRELPRRQMPAPRLRTFRHRAARCRRASPGDSASRQPRPPGQRRYRSRPTTVRVRAPDRALSTPGAQSHSEADRSGPLDDGVGQHAVDADRRQQRRDGCKHGQHDRIKTLPRHGARDEAIQWQDRVERRVRIGACDGASHSLNGIGRIAARAHGKRHEPERELIPDGAPNTSTFRVPNA